MRIPYTTNQSENRIFLRFILDADATSNAMYSDDVIENADAFFNKDKTPIGDSIGLSVRESKEVFGNDYVMDDEAISNLTERAVEDRWKLRLTYCQKTQECFPCF